MHLGGADTRTFCIPRIACHVPIVIRSSHHLLVMFIARRGSLDTRWQHCSASRMTASTAVGAAERLPEHSGHAYLQHCSPWRPVGWPCGNGHVPLAASGMGRHAAVQHAVVTWRCCSGHMQTAVPGVRRLARVQLRAATLRCCSGCLQTAALGMKGHAAAQLKAATCQFCSGRVQTAAPGASRHAAVQQMEATRWCYSGLVTMVVLVTLRIGCHEATWLSCCDAVMWCVHAAGGE